MRRKQPSDLVPLVLLVPRSTRDALKAQLRGERRWKRGAYLTFTAVVRALLAQALEGGDTRG